MILVDMLLTRFQFSCDFHVVWEPLDCFVELYIWEIHQISYVNSSQ